MLRESFSYMDFEQVTAERCASWALLLKHGLAHFGVSVNPTSDVGRMIEALEWLGSFPPDAPQPEAAAAVDRARALRAYPLYEQAIRIAHALTLTRDVPGAEKLAARLRKRVNRLVSQNEQAQDFLFELELGGRFVAQGLTITFEEPDIVLHAEGHRFGIACKRPRNSDRMRERIREAADQIVSRPEQGVIAVGVEALFHHSGDAKRPTVVYLGDPSMLEAEGNRRLDGAIMTALPAIRTAFDAGVLASCSAAS